MNQEFCLMKLRTEIEIPRKATYADSERARIYKSFAHLPNDDFLKLMDTVLATFPHRTLPSMKYWTTAYKDNVDNLTPKTKRVHAECTKCEHGLRRFWCKGRGGFIDKEYIAVCRCSCINGENWSKTIPLDDEVIGHPQFIRWWDKEAAMQPEPVTSGADDISLDDIPF